MKVVLGRLAGLVATSVLACSGLVVTAGPALAARGAGQQVRPFVAFGVASTGLTSVPAGGLVASKIKRYRSHNWSGYSDGVTCHRTYSAVSATWRQPRLTCDDREDRFAAFWVGLDGFHSDTVEQDGTIAECFQGKAYYGTWWEMYPSNNIQVVGTTIKPGDMITSTVSFAHGEYLLKVTDSTTPSSSFSTSQGCAKDLTCDRSSAEWIAEAPTGATGEFPLAQYTPWQVKAAAVTSMGTSGHITTFPAGSLKMIDTTGTYPLATVSGLTDGGRAFTDTWRNSF